MGPNPEGLTEANKENEGMAEGARESAWALVALGRRKGKL